MQENQDYNTKAVLFPIPDLLWEHFKLIEQLQVLSKYTIFHCFCDTDVVSEYLRALETYQRGTLLGGLHQINRSIDWFIVSAEETLSSPRYFNFRKFIQIWLRGRVCMRMFGATGKVVGQAKQMAVSPLVFHYFWPFSLW